VAGPLLCRRPPWPVGPQLPGHENLDDGSWHSSFGDFGPQVRFKATRGSLVVTPLLVFGVPSHSYEFYAHATAGLHLAAGQVGVILGRLLDPWLENAYVQARYTFTRNDKVLGIAHDQSGSSTCRHRRTRTSCTTTSFCAPTASSWEALPPTHSRARSSWP
jgi:hypothetical protein